MYENTQAKSCFYRALLGFDVFTQTKQFTPFILANMLQHNGLFFFNSLLVFLCLSAAVEV